MARTTRERSSTGIYHIIMRGTNRQVIFYDEKDNTKFLETLAKYKERSKMEVYGWCLMGNHVHLLIREVEENISKIIHRVGTSYAWYFNRKYDTVGHVFQGRFVSETVETDEYLMNVIRYIHQNPVKAGIVKKVSEWEWSSCKGYYGKTYHPAGLLDNDFILKMIADSKEKAIEQFILINEEKNNDTCLDDIKKVRLTDKEASEEIRKIVNGYEITKIKSLPKEEKEYLLRKIKKIKGLSLRQAARILGISHVLIHRM